MPSILVAAAGQPLAFHIPNPFSWGASKMIGWIVSGITKAINAFFGGLVKDALNPLLKLLGQTLLTTPDPGSLPRVGALWENSREIAVASYALLILAAGILVMAYETVQTRHSIKEIAPRIVVGFITANMSLLLAGKAVSFANALSTGVLSGGVDPKSAANTLTALVMGAVTNGGIFLVFIGLGLACILLALLVCYVIRVALTVILIAGAPLALMCHALPQTEGIARWWWRAFAGVLAIQLAQSLTLVAALNVFLGKGGFTFFGPTKSGLVDLIVTIALLYILFKIPFWILHSIQVGTGRSFLGGVVKGVIAYKTLGLLGLRGAGVASRRGRPGAGGHPGAGGPGGRGPAGGGPGGGGPRRPTRAGGSRPSGGPTSGTRRSGSSAYGSTRSTRQGGGRASTAGAFAATAGGTDRSPARPRPRLASAPAATRPTHPAPPEHGVDRSRAPAVAARPPVLAGAPRLTHGAAESRSSADASAAPLGVDQAFPPPVPVDFPARVRPTRTAPAVAVAARQPGSSGSASPHKAAPAAAALRRLPPSSAPSAVWAHRPVANPIHSPTPLAHQTGAHRTGR
jgi:hypothetical protein